MSHLAPGHRSPSGPERARAASTAHAGPALSSSPIASHARHRRAAAGIVRGVMLIAFWSVASPQLGHAQAPGAAAAAAPDTVAAIEVTGLQSVDKSVVLSTFGVRPPAAVSGDRIRAGLRALWASNLYSDVQLSARKSGATLILTLAVTERPRIAAIEFNGLSHFESKDLDKKLGLMVGQLLGPEGLAAAVDSIRREYREDGYPITRVRPNILQGPGGTRVVFDVVEGAKVKISAVIFEGNQSVSSEALYKLMKTKRAGGEFKEDVLKKDVDKIAVYYHDHGYRDAVIGTYRVLYSVDTTLVAITIPIQEGKKYSLTDVKFEGVHSLSEGLLRAGLTLKPGDPYNDGALKKSVQSLYEAYQENGYLYLSVDPRLALADSTNRDSSRLALTLAIDEGKPSTIRKVFVTGNTRTKDKVVRRQLFSRPGDVFRRSAVTRSQREAFALGYFEDVQVDYRPVPGTNDIDLVYNVKEKTTGTASAGAGYSNDVGVTGFVQLGMPNFLGNGQNVGLHLERGGRNGTRKDYSLSFTEPWFRDTPTVLGFDASYSTVQRLGFPYLESIQGVGMRLGRPIPKIDYTRGYFDLRTENVRRSDFDSAAVAHDTTGYLVSLRDSLHYPLTVTSVALSLVRNSTNNPFYPTTGSKMTFSENLAGGPLGGYYSYHKEVLDARRWINTPGPGAMMFKTRVAYVHGAKDGAKDRVPDYEYLRLGGTNVNPLRGYTDNSIVPFGNSVYKGGAFALTLTSEFQFPIAGVVHGVFFADVGNTWKSLSDASFKNAYVGAGPGVRLEIPGLGPVGFDYAYGFARLGNRIPHWESHFIVGSGF